MFEHNFQEKSVLLCPDKGYVPIEQFSQLEDELDDEKVPAGQSEQFNAPSKEYFPLEQLAQNHVGSYPAEHKDRVR